MSRHGGHAAQSCDQPLVCGDQTGVQSNRQRKVKRVVHRSPGHVRQRVRVFGQRTARNRFHSDPANIRDQLLPLFGGQFAGVEPMRAWSTP